MKRNYRYILMVMLCLITFFIPKNQSYADDLNTTAYLRFTNDAPLSVVPDIPIDDSGGNQSEEKIGSKNQQVQSQNKDKNLSLLPQTGESINQIISLLGVTIVILVIYLIIKKRKKEGR